MKARVCTYVVCVMRKCVCPGEEFELAAEVSRLQCEAAVHNGLINHTRVVEKRHDAWDRNLRTTPVQDPSSRGASDGEVAAV